MSFDLDSVSGFDSPFFNLGFPKTEPFDDNRAASEAKVAAIFAKTIKPMEVGGSVGGRVDITWGDPEGPTVQVSAQAEAHDDRGNRVELGVSSNDDGTTTVSLSGNAGKDIDR